MDTKLIEIGDFEVSQERILTGNGTGDRCHYPLTLVLRQSSLRIGIAIMSFSHFAFQRMRFIDFVLSLYGACAV